MSFDSGNLRDTSMEITNFLLLVISIEILLLILIVLLVVAVKL